MKYVSNTTNKPITYKNVVIPVGASLMVNNAGEPVVEITDNTEQLNEAVNCMNATLESTVNCMNDAIRANNDAIKANKEIYDSCISELIKKIDDKATAIMPEVSNASYTLDIPRVDKYVWEINIIDCNCKFTATKDTVVCVQRDFQTGYCKCYSNCQENYADSVYAIVGSKKYKPVISCVRSPDLYFYHRYSIDSALRSNDRNCNQGACEFEEKWDLCFPVKKGETYTFCSRVTPLTSGHYYIYET